MFVLTIDQRNSRDSADRVPELLDVLNSGEWVGAIPFERTVGDEVQGVVLHADAAVDITLQLLQQGDWYVGIGIGTIDSPMPTSSREARGAAFVAARDAVEAAKDERNGVPVAVRSLPDDMAEVDQTALSTVDAQAVLRLLGRLVQERSEAQWRVVNLIRKKLGDGRYETVRGRQKTAAKALGITPQAVSKSLSTSGWTEEEAGRIAAGRVLAAVRARADDEGES
ncbi:MarR family transcriptional regulator [Saxibacter everestensis]|uniref:MarR family transcriptional regulator n=1 Tax=Saxibacter everestensis TaxID=2909229 RepID=A0ABY8QVZ8_9MICO|nr:MarR family transcriptional regulator [Brevibacteriaceae bacterium ZFBP1038]